MVLYKSSVGVGLSFRRSNADHFLVVGSLGRQSFNTAHPYSLEILSQSKIHGCAVPVFQRSSASHLLFCNYRDIRITRVASVADSSDHCTAALFSLLHNRGARALSSLNLANAQTIELRVGVKFSRVGST